MKLKKIASLVLSAAMALSMMAPAALAAAPTVEEENAFFPAGAGQGEQQPLHLPVCSAGLG